jgi:hypothetical protein
MSEATTDYIGGFITRHPKCGYCGNVLLVENAWMTDGCPCNSPMGVNNSNETRWRLLMELQQKQAAELTTLRTRLAEVEAERDALKADQSLDAGKMVSDVPGDVLEKCAFAAFLEVKGLDERFFAHAPEATRAMWRSAAIAVIQAYEAANGNSPTISDNSPAETGAVSDEEAGKAAYHGYYGKRAVNEIDIDWTYAGVSVASLIRAREVEPLKAEIERLRGIVKGWRDNCVAVGPHGVTWDDGFNGMIRKG